MEADMEVNSHTVNSLMVNSHTDNSHTDNSHMDNNLMVNHTEVLDMVSLTVNLRVASVALVVSVVSAEAEEITEPAQVQMETEEIIEGTKKQVSGD